MKHQTNAKLDLKIKKSFTLSPESVALLETLRKRQNARSISAILEEVLQAVLRGHEKSSIEEGVADYYSSLSADEATYLARWGDFAKSQERG